MGRRLCEFACDNVRGGWRMSFVLRHHHHIMPEQTTKILQSRLLHFICAITSLAALPAAQAESDSQWWPAIYARVWANEAHAFALYGESWFVEDVSQQKLWLASVKYSYALHQNIKIGANYTYLEIQNLETEVWRGQHRFEFEANPHFKLVDRWQIELRNRLEVAYNENASDQPEFRSRHRMQLSRSLELGRITKLYAGSELFYSFEREAVSEFRSIPLGLRVRLFDPVTLDLNYMIQSKRLGQTSDWYHSNIFGSMLVLSF
jgi:hypothetical protein